MMHTVHLQCNNSIQYEILVLPRKKKNKEKTYSVANHRNFFKTVKHINLEKVDNRYQKE